jgi:hypothetical protein
LPLQLILLIEEDPSVAATIEVVLARLPDTQLVWIEVPALSLDQLEPLKPDLVILRADALASNGERLCDVIHALSPDSALLSICASSQPPPDPSSPQLTHLSWPTTHTDLLLLAKNLLKRSHSSGAFESVPNPAEAALPSGVVPLSDFPFEDLLWRAWISRFCGQITISDPSCRRVISFINGFPVSVTSDSPSEALGSMVVQRGLCDRDHLQRLLSRQRQPGPRLSLGQLLLGDNILTESQLLELLDEQARGRLLSCFELRVASAEVFPRALLTLSADLFIQNPLSIIQLGISRLRDLTPLRAFAQRAASLHVVPSQHFAHQAPYLELGLSRRTLLSQIDGFHTISQLQQQWVGPERTFLQFFWTLHATHTVFLSPHPIPSRTPSPSIDDLLLDREHILRLMTPAPGLRRAARPFDLAQSGQFRVPDPNASAALLHLQTLDPPTLASLDFFSLFNLDPDASPYQIHTRVRSTLHLLDLIDTPLNTLSSTLRSAASTLLDADARRLYRSTLSPLSTQRLDAARLLLHRNLLPEASTILEELDALDPVNPQITTLLARCIYLQHGVHDRVHLARAQALLARAVALDADNADAFHLLGCIERDLHDPDTARRAWTRALSIDPGHRPSHDALSSLS